MQDWAVRRTAKYLVSTSTYVDLPDVDGWLTTRVVIYSTDIEKGIEYYVDAKISGGWDQVDANNTKNAMLHAGYVITYSGFTVLW